MSTESILLSIKSNILGILPESKMMLFGSRAYGVPTDESDWDILILTQQNVNPILKDKIHDVLFPLSVQIGAFINVMTVQETEWKNNPAYYSLQQTIQKGMKQL